MSTTFIAYCITNLLNNKQYIGITTQSIDTRWSEHLSRSKKSISKSAIHSAIHKYGKANFKIEQIASSFNIEDLKQLEILLIEQYNTFREGYNLTIGGDLREFKQETKNKISASKLGHSVSKKTREKLSVITKEQWKNDREKLRVSRCSKWKIIYKDGTEIMVDDLKIFCKNNNISYNLSRRKILKKLDIVNVKRI